MRQVRASPALDGDSRYRSGRCREWIKIKNPAHAAIERAMLIALSNRQRRG
jgi:ATP-dependent DNA ligase